MKKILVLYTFLACFSFTHAQWSRGFGATWLNNDERVFIGDGNQGFITVSGKLIVNGDSDDYGSDLVYFSTPSLSMNESVLNLTLGSSSSSSSLFLQGVKGSNNVYEVFSSGRINLLADNNSSFNHAIHVKDDEALWYDDDYFSWGFGGNWNRFSKPITIGSATEPSSGIGILLTGDRDIRIEGTGRKSIDFYEGILRKGRISYESDNYMEIRNDALDARTNFSIGGRDLFRLEATDYKATLNGDLFISGFINGVSDKRLKKNIKPISNALQSILSLEGKTYNFKSKEHPELNLPSGKSYGLIAQEV